MTEFKALILPTHKTPATMLDFASLSLGELETAWFAYRLPGLFPRHMPLHYIRNMVILYCTSDS